MYLFWFLIEYCFIRAEIQFILLILDLHCLKLGVPITDCELLITPKCNGIKWPYAIRMDSVHQELRQSEMASLYSVMLGVPAELLVTESTGSPFDYQIIPFCVMSSRRLQDSQTPHLSNGPSRSNS